MLLGIFRISGHSMMTYLALGDRVIVSSIPYYFSKPKVSDVVVFTKDGKMLIKRIVKVSDNVLEVRGDNKADSLKIEPIEQKDILGKVIFKLISSS